MWLERVVPSLPTAIRLAALLVSVACSDLPRCKVHCLLAVPSIQTSVDISTHEVPWSASETLALLFCCVVFLGFPDHSHVGSQSLSFLLCLWVALMWDRWLVLTLQSSQWEDDSWSLEEMMAIFPLCSHLFLSDCPPLRWFSPFVLLWPFNTVPNVVLTLDHITISVAISLL